MGPNNGAANDFTLPDGTVLQQPLTETELYDQFANAWRVTQSTSLFDYGPGQTTATFTDQNFPEAPLTLSELQSVLPPALIAQAQSAVAAAGITDPGAAAAAEFDYIVTGDPAFVTSDAAALAGVTTTQAAVNPSGPIPVTMGVYAPTPTISGSSSGPTQVTFEVYLTAAEISDTTVAYQLNAPDASFLSTSAFGDNPPSGDIVIPAGQTTGQFTIDVTQDALSTAATENLRVLISSPDGTPLLAPTAQATIVNPPTPGPPPTPEIADLTNFGTFTENGNDYTLNLGALQLGQYLPTLQFAIVNAATPPADEIGGTFTVASVAGYTVTGASLPEPIDAGQDYTGLTVTPNSEKINTQSVETITFTPTDTNATGYSAPMAPLTLTIEDVIVPPTMYYSEAWGDVHIITYNGLKYNFQAEGEFTLAKSSLPNDTFDIQLRLQPWHAGASVTVITQVAVSVGTDRVTFDFTRPDFVELDGIASTISLSDPVVNLSGGKLVKISPTQFQVFWNTGEEMTVTNEGSYLNVTDGIPLAELGNVAGLQGEGEGQPNDFQLPDGTVLQQPLTTATLYGEYANAWRVTQQTSLFDYLPGQTTATFTNLSFPTAAVDLWDLPASLVAQAQSLVAAAGITDPGIAEAAEYDYLATGDPSFITSAADVSQTGFTTTDAQVTESTSAPPLLGVMAVSPGVVEATSGPTPVTFDSYITQAVTTDTAVDYSLVGPSGTLATGQVTIPALQTSEPFTVDVPQTAIGTAPNVEVQATISTPGTIAIFAPTADVVIANDTPEPGSPAIPMLAELSQEGTLIQNGSTYTLDLGTLLQGQVVDPVQLEVVNAATPPADDLSGTFTPPLGSGFIIIGNDLPSAVQAGQSYGGLYVQALVNTLGSNSETLTFTPVDENDSGYQETLPAITLVVEDTVTTPAAAQLNTPNTIIFPAVHVGGMDSQNVSITNTASPPADSLDVDPTATGSATVTGTILQLAPGATDATDISVGLDTSSAGAVSGAVTLNATSDPPSAAGAPLTTSPIVDVFGSIYRLASATITPSAMVVHVGDPGTMALAVTNTDPADGYSENLIASLAGVTGGIGIASAGPTGEIAAGATDDTSLSLSFSTAQAGTVSGTATVDLTSDGGTGASSIDGLGTTTLPAQAVPVDVTVDNYAQPAFEVRSGSRTLIESGGTNTLDLGTRIQGSGSLTVDLGVLNAASGPADLLSGSFSIVGDSLFTNSGFTAFSGIDAGQADTGLVVTFDPSSVGAFSDTITLDPVSNASGYSSPLPTETLTITADVMCFCVNTLIATPSGERPVQELAVGHMVMTHRGAARRIVWVGTGKVLATRGRRNAATPVIVRRGALADNVPNRDLRVTKGHSFYIDDVLIPVEFLVNHRSILWDDNAQEVELYHIELETHDVLVANGAPAESYRDDGNRWLFRNANSGWGLPPQVPCAPVLTGGPVVDAAWRRLLERAGPRPGIPTTDDPDLHLLVDGRRVGAASRDRVWQVFRLPVRPGVCALCRAAACRRSWEWHAIRGASVWRCGRSW